MLHLIIPINLALILFLLPCQSTKIKYYLVTSNREIIEQKKTRYAKEIETTIKNFNSKSFCEIITFHCYELEKKDTAYSLDLIYKKEKINPSKLIRVVNQENGLLSKNWVYFFDRKKRGSIVWKTEIVYMSIDSLYIGVVKVKNMEK